MARLGAGGGRLARRPCAAWGGAESGIWGRITAPVMRGVCGDPERELGAVSLPLLNYDEDNRCM
jgi:hypothetical protein